MTCKIVTRELTVDLDADGARLVFDGRRVSYVETDGNIVCVVLEPRTVIEPPLSPIPVTPVTEVPHADL